MTISNFTLGKKYNFCLCMDHLFEKTIHELVCIHLMYFVSNLKIFLKHIGKHLKFLFLAPLGFDAVFDARRCIQATVVLEA